MNVIFFLCVFCVSVLAPVNGSVKTGDVCVCESFIQIRNQPKSQCGIRGYDQAENKNEQKLAV